MACVILFEFKGFLIWWVWIMKKHIDFLIHSYNCDDDRLILRFYTKKSHVHGFGEEPPKTWKDVYKVYFAYSVLSQELWGTEWKTDVLYEEEADECSCLMDLSYVLGEIISGNSKKEKYDLYPLGDGTSWHLIYHSQKSSFDLKPRWEFQLWQSWVHKGYYFMLDENELVKLKDKIDEFLNYMIKHSEGI